MKKISFLWILFALFLYSCELDRMPETAFTDVDFWNTENDLRNACNRLYEQLSGFSHDTRSDELVGKTQNAISSGNRTVPATSDDWKLPYDRIFISNNIITKAVNANITDAAKNRWIAEARFFRAYEYFGLVKKYGGVPLILKVFDSTDDPEIYKGRSTREDVIAQCYEDLDFAAQYLPAHASLPAANWGRVTRSAALALTARIGLNIGTLTKFHELESEGVYKAHLKRSIDAAEAVMREGHSLYADFQKLFYFDGEGSANKENIFVKVYGPNGAGTTVHGNSRGMENAVSVTRQMIDLFLYSDGLPFGKTAIITPKEETSYSTVLENRDPRLKMTIFGMRDVAYKNSDYMPFFNEHGSGYSLRKGFMNDEWLTNSKETVDKMLIRYAEVLITYAEAIYEYNGAISDAQLDQTVNALRDRVHFTVKLTNSFAQSNSLDIREEIRRERTVELLDEGFRYDDIIRWKIAEKVLPVDIIGAKFVQEETTKKREDLQNRLTDNTGNLNGKFVYDQEDLFVIELKESRSFNPQKDYLYPIPLNEIALTQKAITQNPSWE
ncbi:RagB/SusD family nutrient uptake outer membrane protein [termite gut metagenome]|uniref:RagB/SusD family nutrient uptake outer membrane protein n=1 Tax=termite gut metagenome TaxID=433724 RepID=A0A5J4SAU1_9ZZZZ